MDKLGLGDILSQPVIASAPTAPVLEPEETFEQTVELTPEPEPRPQQQPSFFVAENVDDPADYSQEPEPQSLSPDDLAVIAVNVLDGLQRFGFTLARKKMMFTEAELDALGNIDMSEKLIYPEGSKEAILKEKFKKHLEVVKTLPFQDDEKQRLTDATKIYARTTQIKVSPFQGLLLAYSEVLGMRAFNVFSE